MTILGTTDAETGEDHKLFKIHVPDFYNNRWAMPHNICSKIPRNLQTKPKQGGQ